MEDESLTVRLTEKKHWREIVALVLLLFAIWVPRFLKLRDFVTIDEPLWVTRAGNFYCALSKGSFANTFQREHPGVVTMWIGLLGYLWEEPDYIDGCSFDIIPEDHEEAFRARGFDPLRLLVVGRFLSILAVTGTLFLSFFYARRLLGFWSAWFGFLLIAFDPFHAAFSHLLHLDGIMSSLVLLTLLSFVCYLRDRRPRDLIVSGIVAGLSCLSKSPAVILLPFAGLLSLLDLIRSSLPLKDKTAVKQAVWRSAWPLIVFGGMTVAVFALLWPSMWVDPVGTVMRVFDKANHYAAVGHRNPIFFDGHIVEDGNLGLEFYYFYPLTYLWRSTPVVLAGLLAAVIAFVTKFGPFGEKRTRWLCVDLVLFAAFFALMMTLGGKKFDRYLLPAYPVLDLVSALGWIGFTQWFGRLSGAVLRPRIKLVLPLALVVLGQLVPLVKSFPYYLSYYNPLMGGSRKAPEVMLIGWGEGLDLAATYLNAKPNAEQLKVFSWYEPGSFSYFFNGISDGIPARHKIEDVNWGTAFFSSDAYVVTYANQWQRRESWHLIDYLVTQIPEHTVWINGLEYARIYKLNSHLDFYNAPTYEQVDVMLGDRIMLEGYDVAQRTFASGESLFLSLSWRALEAPGEKLKGFVHLSNSSGELVSQSDGEPMVALRPTEGWRTGEQIADHYKVVLPEDLPAGDYTLRVGMYHLSGERLAMTQDGESIGDVFSLGTITIR